MTNALQGLLPAEWGVRVTLGPVPAALPDPSVDEGFVQAAPGRILGLVDGVGRILVTADTVTLDPQDDDLDVLASLVYGWAPRWIRILRGQFGLHASTVVIDGAAVALVGTSGAGKSTTVTALAQRGYDLLLDDMLPIDLVDGLPMVQGWTRPVHLTPESTRRLEIDAPTRPGPRAQGKGAVDLPQVSGQWPLRTIVLLSRDPETTVVTRSAVVGPAKVATVLGHANGARLSAADGREQAFFHWVTTVAGAVSLHRVTRPEAGWHLAEVVCAVEAAVADRAAI